VAVVTSARYPLEQLRVTQLSMAPLAAGAGAAVVFSHGRRSPSRPLARPPRASASFHCRGGLPAGTPTAVLSCLLAKRSSEEFFLVEISLQYLVEVVR
jgi:hypothetical protein